MSIKPCYGLVRASLNFVRALLNSIKLVSTLTCSSARVRVLTASAALHQSSNAHQHQEFQ